MVNVDENKEYTEENIEQRTKRGDIVVVNVLLPYAPFKHSLLQSFNPSILQSFNPSIFSGLRVIRLLDKLARIRLYLNNTRGEAI